MSAWSDTIGFSSDLFLSCIMAALCELDCAIVATLSQACQTLVNITDVVDSYDDCNIVQVIK